MTIQVNGERREIEDGATVGALLDLLDLEARLRGVAVAVDSEVVPRGEWYHHALSPGARVEVLSAIQGG